MRLLFVFAKINVDTKPQDARQGVQRPTHATHVVKPPVLRNQPNRGSSPCFTFSIESNFLLFSICPLDSSARNITKSHSIPLSYERAIASVVTHSIPSLINSSKNSRTMHAFAVCYALQVSFRQLAFQGTYGAFPIQSVPVS